MANTSTVERTVVSALIQDAELRNKLISNYPGVTGEPQILFSSPEAIELVPNILSQSGRYSSAMYASILNTPKADWCFDKIRFEATTQDLASFLDHAETLRKNRKHERFAQAITQLQGKYKQIGVEDIDGFVSQTSEEFGRIALSNLVGNIQANADEIDDILQQQLADGQKFKVPTGIEALDYLTGGGLHISKNGGELIVIGGKPKNRKSSFLHNLIYSVLTAYPDMRIGWFSTEPAFTPTDIEADFIAKIATDWTIKNCRISFDFSHDDALVGRRNPQGAFNIKEKNAAIQYAIGVWRGWGERMRVFGPGLREGNTTDFDSTMALCKTEVEARGCDLIVIDRAQEWLEAGDENSTMRRVTHGISEVNAKYHVPICVVAEYNSKEGLSYGGAMEYALSIWIECRYNSKETPDIFEMEIKRGRYVGASTVKQKIMPKSGLLLERLGFQR